MPEVMPIFLCLPQLRRTLEFFAVNASLSAIKQMLHFCIKQTPDLNIGFLPLNDNGSNTFHIQNEDINPNCKFC